MWLAQLPGSLGERHLPPVFETTIRFTLLSQVFILIFANILAVIFTQNFTGKWFARFIFILPLATPVSLAMIGWLWMLDTKYSPIDYLLLQLGFLVQAAR